MLFESTTPRKVKIMAIDYVVIGSAPACEDCAQINSDNYETQSRAELKALKAQMLRILGEPPMGAGLKIKSFSHDFGLYHELCAVYDDSNDEAIDWAFRAENELPDCWDAEAIKELTAKDISVANIKRH
jgi:hypothetical protein